VHLEKLVIAWLQGDHCLGIDRKEVLQEKGLFHLRKLLCPLVRNIQIGLPKITLGVGLDLLNQGGHQVKVKAHSGMAVQDLYHILIVLTAVQPDPGKLDLPGQEVPVIRLVHMINNRQI